MNQSVQNITEDFQIFLSYLKNKKEVSLTKDGMKLKSKDLFAMNQLVHNQTLWVTEKNSQMRFTIFNLFYWICIYGKLATKKKNAKGENIFEFDNERVEDFLMLNTSEQYCFLLKTMWCDMNWEKLYDDRSTYFIQEGLNFLEKSPADVAAKIAQNRFSTDTGLYLMKAPYCEIFAYMGWYEIVYLQQIKKYDAYELPFVSVASTAFGTQMEQILSNQRIFHKNNRHEGFYDDDEDLRDDEKGDFIEPFKKLFDETIDSILELPPHEFVSGKYTFKLEIDKKSYRIIEIDGGDTLLDLHDIIQEALEFENDHMFSFTIGDEEEIVGNPWGHNDGLSDQEPAEVRLGDIEFYIGQTIDYAFDFGDNWHFDVILLEINPDAKPLKSAKIIKKIGKAPEQYEDYDEDNC
ncbi:MAG: hypothetical protein U5N85_13345 [Arcicella sp.]|nr:hypothetical protein [Arcicella sp.]